MINLDFLNTISTYEIMHTAFFVLLSIIALSLFVLFITNDRRSAIISVLSNITTLILDAIALYTIFLVPDVVLNNRYYLVLWLPFTINTLNVLMLNLEYREMKLARGFDIDFVSRYHFNLSLNLGLILSIFALLTFVFIPRELAFIIALSSLLILLSLSITHLLVRRFLKEK